MVRRLGDLLHNRLPDGTPRAFPASRFLTIVIGISTLITAGVGYLLNNASAQSAQAGSMAQILNQQASDALRAGSEEAASDYFAYVMQHAQSNAYAAATWNGVLDESDAQHWQAEASVWKVIAAAQANNLPPDLDSGAATGQFRDPAFPSAFFAERVAPGTTRQAQADGQSDMAAGWGKLVGSYGVALAMIAIALYLLSNALNLAGRNRLAFSLLGLTLVLGSSVWVAVITPGAPRAASDAAAEAYTRGVTLETTARTPKDFQPAVDAFAAAIASRPDYARAYEEKAQAELDAGAVQLGFGDVTLVQPQWRDRAVADAEHAYDLGVRDEEILFDLPFGLYQQWLENGVGVVSAQAVQLADQLVLLDPTNPLTVFDRATYDLASDDSSGAKQSYDQFLGKVLSTHAYNVKRGYVAAALSALDDLANSPAPSAHPGMLDTINKEVALLTASVAGTPPTSDSHITDALVPQGQVTIVRDSNHLSATFPAPAGWGAAKGEPTFLDQPVMVAWYQRNATSGWPDSAWTAVPDATLWGSGMQSPLSYDSGQYKTSLEDLMSIGRCLPPGQYRVDVFVAGHVLLSGRTMDLGGADLAAHYRGEIGLGVCVPSTWKSQAAGIADVVTSDVRLFGIFRVAGENGAVILRVDEPKDLISGRTQDQLQTFLERFLEGVIQSPGAFGLPVQLFNTLRPVSVQPVDKFADLEDPVVVEYLGPNVEVLGGGGLTKDGAFEFGFVFGKPQDFATNQSQQPGVLRQVFSSFGPTP
jgi:tetratricopeptide (TPR) repeat protein